jgi:putative glutamine amidotransferase
LLLGIEGGGAAAGASIPGRVAEQNPVHRWLRETEGWPALTPAGHDRRFVSPLVCWRSKGGELARELHREEGMRLVLRHLACALLLAALLAGPALAGKPVRPYLVEVDGLGPMLLCGSDPAAAITSYVAGLERRGVFTAAAPRLRDWGRALAARPSARPAEELRRGGRPVIGIQLNLLSSLLGGADGSWGATRVAAAVRRAGGTPVFLPPGGSLAQIDRLLDQVDHLVLSGGDDVHPRLYGQPITHALDLDLNRDRYERRLLSRAIHRGLGVDGICRGAQLLNVKLGGTLFQDLLADHATSVSHRGTRHAVVLDRTSFTAQAIGKTRLVGLSAHHQATERVARGLRVAGRSPDGIVEVVESPDGQVRGYQFHPEASRGASSRAIFAGIVSRARQLAPTRRARTPQPP